MKKRRLYHLVWDEIEEIREEERLLRERMHRRGRSRLLAMAALMAASALMFFGLAMEPAVALTVEGERIAYAKNAESYESTLEELKEEAEEDLETELLTEDAILSLAIVPSDAIEDEEGLRNEILGCCPIPCESRYAFYLEDVFLGAVMPEELEEAREKIEEYRKAVCEAYAWADDLEVTGTLREEKRLAMEEEFATPDQLYAALKAADGTAECYTLRAGEDYRDVAKRFGLVEESLKDYNPGRPLDSFREGDEIAVSRARRAFDVTYSYQTTYTGEIPFEVEYKNTRTLLIGEEGVRSEGVSGLEEISAAITVHNGTVTSQKILSKTVIREPVGAVHLKGVRKDTGKLFYVPVDGGRISSEFGYRTLFGRRDYHTGVDFVVPEGTYVYAAADGVVKSSGVIGNGAYGKVVVIDHQNGFVTYYAHNSKLLVEVGEQVVKGEAIALSGNTGRSTGPHCHFEVRKNGVQVDPFRYMERP